jgi:phage terminase large subunit-like protein
MDDFKKAGIDRNAFKELVKGKECFIGLDLSKRIDLTACGYVFPLEDGKFGITAQGFIPEDCARKHELTDRVPYIDWARDDWCKLTPGNVIDYNFIKQYIYDNELDEGWKIKEVCYDPYNAEHFTQELEAKGYTRIEIRQGVQTLSEPIKRFRELVMQGKIIHDNNPLLIWCISNAIEIADNNGNIKLNKRTKDDSQRIDLLAAIINACVRAFAVEENKKTIYRERGVITV